MSAHMLFYRLVQNEVMQSMQRFYRISHSINSTKLCHPVTLLRASHYFSGKPSEVRMNTDISNILQSWFGDATAKIYFWQIHAKNILK